MPVTYTFANATTAIPLSQLDTNFATPITIGNTAVQLGNTITTVNNLTLVNATVTSVSTPITAAQGGTGLATLTANNVLIGNGTGSVTFVAPGTNGNVLTSNGTAWVSTAAGASGFPITLGNTSIAASSTTTTLGNLTLTNPTLGTPASGNLTNCTADGTNGVGYINIPQNSQNGSYTLVAADAGKHIFHPSGQAAATYTIPANSSVSYATGTALTFINMSANAVTIAITTDTMYLASTGTTGSRTLAQYGTATAVKITGTNWIISGNGLT